MAWDFGNNLNWDLALRQTYTARPASPTNPDIFVPIPALTVSVDSTVLLIGARNQFAKPRWYLAGSASRRLLFSPSSTSEFVAAVSSQGKISIGLNRLTLINFRDFNLTPYLLEINIARWHREMYLEVWKYSGSIADIENSLNRIEFKIDAIDTYSQ